MKCYDGKSENAVYYVQTATGSIPLSNKTITPTHKSPEPSTKSLEILVSRSECEQKLNALRNGVLDLNSISVQEWIEMSYMSLFMNQELHLDVNIVDRGNVFHLHTCVQGVVPPVPTEKLGQKV